MKRRSLAAVLLLACSVPALAALPPWEYEREALEAAHNLRIAVDRVAVGDQSCRVEGRVTHVFRGDPSIGAPVRFALSCLRPGEVGMPGPAIWFAADAVSEARAMEGFFNGTAPDLTAARGEVRIVDPADPAPAWVLPPDAGQRR